MSRIRKSKIEAEEVDINVIRGKIREELVARYGGVREFLRTPQGEKMGGMKIRSYLYDKGVISYPVISTLCAYLGIGSLTRETVIIRKNIYRLVPSITSSKKPS